MLLWSTSVRVSVGWAQQQQQKQLEQQQPEQQQQLGLQQLVQRQRERPNVHQNWEETLRVSENTTENPRLEKAA